MTFLAILVLALALSMDAFAVSLAASTCGRITSRRAAFRLSFHFGLFQFRMPVVGWRLGEAVEPVVASFDHWIAVALLAFVAARMIRAGLDSAEAEQADDPQPGSDPGNTVYRDKYRCTCCRLEHGDVTGTHMVSECCDRHHCRCNVHVRDCYRDPRQGLGGEKGTGGRRNNPLGHS